MAILNLDRMTTLQMQAAEVLYRKCCSQRESDSFATGLECIYYKASMRTRAKCLPRGKAYRKAYRREMNPHIDFRLKPGHPDRYGHMKKRLWSK